MRQRGGWALAAGVALTMASAGPAAAGRLDFGGEVRAATTVGVGSIGQFGLGSGPCGLTPTLDGGGNLSATVAALLSSARYRHQLTASVGYYALYCTPLLRRPVGGLDYRGEHALGDRTRLQAAAHYTFDVIDPSISVLSGTGTFLDAMPGGGAAMTPTPMLPSGGAAVLPYVVGQASLEVTHSFSKLSALRAGVQLHSLEVLGALRGLPYYSTLGPMESVAFHLSFGRNTSRNRFELPLRYRLSTFYSATWLNLRKRGQVPAAQDVQLSPAWERRLSPKLTLHVEAGVALAVQPHLCAQFDPLLIAGNRCSLDARAPGIRGYDSPPPLEAHLGRLATLTGVGEVSLSYIAPRRRFELHLLRGYDPDPYAGALSLIDRLSGNLHWRPVWALLLYGSAQLLHAAQTSPARVSPSPEGLLLQPLSPQNRTLWMTMGQVGADYQVVGPLAVFLETTFQALKIRGEKVPQSPNQGPGLAAEVSMFPNNSLGPATSGDGPSYQDNYRVNLLVGVRVQLDTLPSARREPDLFTEARAVP